MKNGTVSSYAPKTEEREVLDMIRQHFQLGRQIAIKPYRELNDMSLTERMAEDQKAWLSYQEPRSDDPDEAWRSNAIRGIVRNRAIQVAAHLGASLIFPQVHAQNQNDEEDKDAGLVMQDLMEYVTEQSNYDRTFIYSLISALVNPATIIYTEFSEIKRKIKEIKEDGTWTEKEILDEIFSGFRDLVVPLDELFIGDVYEHDIQKQPFLLWRRAIDYTQAQAKYADNVNWKHVKPGLELVYDNQSGQFYEVQDDDLGNRLVEEAVYWNRQLDLRLIVVNGVLMTKPDQPNPRKDKRYPFAKGVFELIDEGKFFYGFSLVRKMQPEYKSLNFLLQTFEDMATMLGLPPLAIFGGEEKRSNVLYPGKMFSFENPEAKIQPIQVGGDLNALLGAINLRKEGITESSQDIRQAGVGTPGSETLGEVRIEEMNANIMLGLFAKFIGFLVQDLGELKVNDILQFMTIGEVTELTSPNNLMRFRAFVVKDRMVGPKKETHRIELTTKEFSEGPRFDLLKREEETNQKIYQVNPKLFRELKFKVKVVPEAISPPSDRLKQLLDLEMYRQATQNPFANLENLYRDLLLPHNKVTREDPDRYVVQPQAMPGQAPQQPQGSVLNKLLGGEAQGLGQALT